MGARRGRPAMASIGDLRSEGIPPPRPSRRGFEGHPRPSQTIGVPQNCQHRLERSGLQLGYALLKALEKTPFRSTTTWFIIPPSLLPVRNPNSTIRPTMARRTSNDPQAIANVLRVLPAKWIIGLLVAVVLYFFLQPRLMRHQDKVPGCQGQTLDPRWTVLKQKSLCSPSVNFHDSCQSII